MIYHISILKKSLRRYRDLEDKKKELRKIAGSSMSIMAGTLAFAALFSVYKPEPLTIMANAESADRATSRPGITSDATGTAVDDHSKDVVMENINKDVVVEEESSEEQNLEAEPAVVVAGDESSSSSAIDPALLSDTYVKIPKAAGSGKALVTDNYLYRTVYLDIDNASLKDYKNIIPVRVKKDKTYDGDLENVLLPPYITAFLSGADSSNTANQEDYDKADKSEKKSKTGDPLAAFSVSKNEDGSVRFSFTFNRLYVPALYEDNDYYYINLQKPKDVYDKIIVIDAGHGGKDPGSYSLDGDVAEKNINLKIANFMKDYFDGQDNIKVYYTRTTDSTTYLRSRADLANELDADLFVSIHNNAFYSDGVDGSEVLYNQKNKETITKSRKLAELLLKSVTETCGTRYRGLQDGSGIYVIHHTNMPSVLVEVGYLTDTSDLAKLNDDTEMKKCADNMCKTIVDFLGV